MDGHTLLQGWLVTSSGPEPNQDIGMNVCRTADGHVSQPVINTHDLLEVCVIISCKVCLMDVNKYVAPTPAMVKGLEQQLQLINNFINPKPVSL